MSVLFVDLVGFTMIAEGRDSEDVRDLLTRYFDLASEIVIRYGGTIEKFIGDAVMAVWGTPTAREDDAERCVRAALELVQLVPGLGSDTVARAGVVTGEVSVTMGAANQGMVAGDIVNTAARLQSVADAGSVLVGETTRRLASSAIAFEPAGEQVLKGRHAPVSAFRALRIVAERGGRGRSDGLEAPFVGRDDELRLVKDLFHATVRERRTRLMSITGVGGIGKSRLAWEFEKYLDGIVGTVWWHRGRSPAYGTGITFWALGEMIRGRAGLLEGDDEPTTRHKITTLLDGLSLAEAERRWIELALLALLGIEGGLGSEQLFGAWRTFFERLAASAPVVLVFEDLHWADSGTVDFIDDLLEWNRTLPLYVVTLARPELVEVRPDWGAGRRNFTSLYLEPLTGPAMGELLSGLVPGLPESATRAVVERAEGIPLYAVETVRMLLADGRITAAGDGTYRPAGDLTALAIPETLTALIAARLDGLDHADRSLLLDAAVLGQAFTPTALAAVSGIGEAEIEARLRSLVRRELLAHQTDPRSPERGQYVFVQALIREVAYNTLARRDRKIRHLAAARFFEGLGSDELAAVLARHYLAALENAPPGSEADAVRAQARLAVRAAAERAAALGSHDQAVALYEEALKVTIETADRADILNAAGESASAAARHDAAESFLNQALALQRSLGDRAAEARTTTALARALLTGRHNDRALAILVRATTEFADLAPSPVLVELDAQLARAYMLREDLTGAIETAERVLPTAEHADLGPLLADALVTKGTALANLGRLREGLAVIEGGERLALALDLPSTVLRALNNRLVSQLLIDPTAAGKDARAGLDLARRIGDRSWTFSMLEKLNQALWTTGDWDTGLELALSALEEGPEPGDRLAFLDAIIRIRAARGEPVAAELDQLLSTAPQITDPQMLWTTVDATAFAAFAAGQLEAATSAWHEGLLRYKLKAPEWLYLAATASLRRGARDAAADDLANLDRLGLRARLVELRRSSIAAGLAALDSRSEESTRLYESVLGGLRDLPAPVDEALVTIGMATVLDPGAPAVKAAAARAREILRDLGARPLFGALAASLVRDTEDAVASVGTSRNSEGSGQPKLVR